MVDFSEKAKQIVGNTCWNDEIFYDLTVNLEQLLSRLADDSKCSCYADGKDVLWCDRCQSEAAISSLMIALSEAKQRISDLESGLKPFAAIKPSSFNAEDGSENEGYRVILCTFPEVDKPDFTGLDLAKARDLFQ